MGSGEGRHHLLSFHLHRKVAATEAAAAREVPKGCLAVMVGQQGEEQQRFVVPVDYFNHPLFMPLLKEAEDEYGFDQKGPISIPCHVAQFRYVQAVIAREASAHHHHHHPHHHHHHHQIPLPCFRA